MAHILLVGSDEALLEGLAQMLAHAGYTAHTAPSAFEAMEDAAIERPLVAIVERGEAVAHAEVARLPVAGGGALLVYHSGAGVREPLPPALQRMVLAELTLPLERHRLITLVQRVDERVRATGHHPDAPPERHASDGG